MSDEGTLWILKTPRPSGGGWVELGAVQDLKIGYSTPLDIEAFDATGTAAPSPTYVTPTADSRYSYTAASGTRATSAGEQQRNQEATINRQRPFPRGPNDMEDQVSFRPGPLYGQRMHLYQVPHIGGPTEASILSRVGTVLGEISLGNALSLARHLTVAVMPHLGLFIDIPARALTHQEDFEFEGAGYTVVQDHGRDTLLVMRLETSPTVSGLDAGAGPSQPPGSTTFQTGTTANMASHSVYFSVAAGTDGFVADTLRGDDVWTAPENEEVRMTHEGRTYEGRVQSTGYTISLINVAAMISVGTASEFNVLVPTNAKIRTDGRAVMGRGFAAVVKNRVCDSDLILGKLISIYGSRVQWITGNVFAFPTKDDWREPSSMEIILRSCAELRQVAKGSSKLWYLPLPGCGAGELDFRKVLPVVEGELASVKHRFVTTDKALFGEYEGERRQVRSEEAFAAINGMVDGIPF